MKANDLLPIGDLARRTGLSVSAIRFYEEKGLVEPHRTAGNQRRFLRSDIRRLSFILIAQKLGLSLSEIEEALAGLPQGRTPNAADWKRISGEVKKRIDAQIAALEKVREDLDGCIGCGCLSLKKCALYNAGDKWGEGGSGPRVLR
ncbi:redox-sensitive transcriptional activator SoxR [Qipengyuania sp. 1NDW9]|uniref:Redox-sensitive transcriptional activator SoxR n=2 Tax=Qipengyuania TaxID=1855416 RepID=A0A9Q3S1S1_9SPHN|nr:MULTISPECIES: redox-sensitive transcriptional activator SoxR [Qipengyuania]MBX7492593.1 redox-sensitive transcriptional activator SoxR [Qipengyuania xiapuensis]MBY6128246.1 redox-sensitive transcriptional activator SoxR [Qipengyuania aquimaris]MBY6218235.1 redox-sensitive transcriptional activator SoxR [Qipengyuania aquimaris]QZD93205.1 redox-sensitive transcriptional activator SoxR [Qipengyuania xiapuensis]UOR15322.1 redox-sensitive transcriptional activator SoxR [Qipengyuania aquimaris]